ncbi:MAG: hypothetical protein AAFZ52_10580, partial [Bacteroidota bacterium]
HQDGRYHWYDQLVVPGAINAAGIMTCHLNYYRDLGTCANHLPEWPVVYTGGKPDPEINAHFLAKRDALGRALLEHIFTERQVKFLEQYRALEAVRQGREPDRKTVWSLLASSRDSYDKLLPRCLESIDDWFEDFATPDTFAFARWFNDFFGPPVASS